MNCSTRLTPLCVAVLLAGCSLSPSYTPERAETMLVAVCRDHYQLSVTTRRLGRTLYASMQIPGFLRRVAESGKLTAQDTDRMNDLLIVTSQIGLSTHPAFEFYVLRIADPEYPGAEYRYVVYLDDVRRLYADALSPVEFAFRRIEDAKASAEQRTMSDPWMEREVALGEFLAVQLALRLKASALQDPDLAAWHLEDCVGWFREGAFSFAIARSSSPSGAPSDPAWPRPALALLARVLHEYHMEDYQRILLKDTTTQTTQELTKTDLAAYYKQR